MLLVGASVLLGCFLSFAILRPNVNIYPRTPKSAVYLCMFSSVGSSCARDLAPSMFSSVGASCARDLASKTEVIA